MRLLQSPKLGYYIFSIHYIFFILIFYCFSLLFFNNGRSLIYHLLYASFNSRLSMNRIHQLFKVWVSKSSFAKSVKDHFRYPVRG